MKKLPALVFAIASLLCALPARADDASQAAARRLIDLVMPKVQMRDTMLKMMQPAITNLRQRGISEKKIAEFQDAMSDFVDAVVNDPEMPERMAALYEKSFTTDELNQIYDMYSTPLGKKTLEVLPQLMQEGAVIGQELAQKHQPEFEARLQKIMQEPDDAPEEAPAGAVPPAEGAAGGAVE